ncbi:MAG: TonB-dependent receptor [Bacteroidetes bacterium]|nr:TonB-dependent receptor [Bacteroidota bacterium]
MYKSIAYITLFLLVAFRLGATNLLIEVKDKATLHNLADASCTYTSANGKTMQALSDAKGNLLINDTQFPLILQVRYISYTTYNDTLTREDMIEKEGQYHYQVLLEPGNTAIQDLVVTGQVIPVLAKQSLYKVQSISNTEMQRRGAVSMNDVLNFEMNNFISNDNVLGSNVNIGGIGGQNVKVLINGIPVMGRENGNIDMGQLNLNNVKRVEMIQGPMSVMYGSNALGGVINLITSSPQKKVSLGARAYYESIGRYNFSGNIGFNKKKQQIQISFARNFFAGWTPKDSIDRYQVWKPKTQYTADLQYWTEIKKWKLNYYSSLLQEKITNKGEPIINPYEGYAFDEYYRTTRLMNALSLNRFIRKNTDQITLTNSFQNYKRIKNRIKKDLVTLDEIETQSIGDQDTTRFENFNSRGVYSTTRFKNLDMMLGYEYAYELGRSYKLADESQQMSEWGVFASGVYKVKKFQIQPSGRLTYNSRYHSAFTPALHAKYDIGQTQLRASYARGFRTPTLKELYLQFIDQNHTIIGNPDLQPETGDHFELSAEHQKPIKKYTVGYTITGSYNAINNLITLAVFNNHGVLRQYQNIEEYRNWVGNFKVRLSEKRFSASSGVGLIYVGKSSVTPKHTIFEYVFTGSYQIAALKTGLNFNYKYNSKQPVITIDQQFLYSAPLHMANISLQRNFLKQKMLVQVGVKNLLNLQNITLSGNVSTQNNGHATSGVMQAFPARSIFADLSYSF